jgi:hypothetical protein
MSRVKTRTVLVILAAAGLVAVLVLWTRTEGGRTEPEGARGIPAVSTSPEQSTLVEPAGKVPLAWQAPNTVNPREFAEAFAAAIWTYDSRTNTYDQWRLAVSSFADPDGPPAAAEVARGMLPLWAQWEVLARERAHATARDVRSAVPPEMSALRADPRAPLGWYGFVVRARQEVTVAGTTSATPRQASVAVVCRARCHLWSASVEAP